MVNPANQNSVAQTVNPLDGTAQSDRFLREFWQQKPAVIRQALSPAELDHLTIEQRKADPAEQGLTESVMRALACDDETESRLIRRRGKRWQLEHGPFEANALPSTATRRWTLLVQGVDQHLERASELLHRFNFVPQARLDDLMISIASDQGGVGPHLDSYDVFLLQLHGTRRWTLGKPGDYDLQADQPIRLVNSFKPYDSLNLVPGDMLYVPPGWVHDGVAQGPCVTASIGFRAPAHHELLAAWLQECADHLFADSDAQPSEHPPQFSDRLAAAKPAAWRRNPGQLPTPMVTELTGWLDAWQPKATMMEDFIGRYLTEPKATVWFDRPASKACNKFKTDAKRNGVKLDRRSRVSFRARVVYINGEETRSIKALPPLLKQLLNQRQLNASDCESLWPDAGDWLAQWHEAGWLQIAH